MKKAKEVARTFDELSERYDEWYFTEEGELIKEIEIKAVQKLIPEGRGLEVGVGGGTFASGLGVRFGLDPSEKLLRKARDRGVDVVLGVGEELPFQADSFDYLLSVATLSFLSDPSLAFREARRVLRPYGRIVTCFVPGESSWGQHYRKKKSEGHDFYKHANFLEISQVRDILREAGLEVVRATSTLFQSPGDVSRMEEPVEGLDRSAGFCCADARLVE